MNRQLKKKIWLCGDVWLNILPFFDHAQLGLKMALLSDRFDILVDKHFDGKTEITLSKWIKIQKAKGTKAKLSVWIGGKFVDFPMPNHSLPIKIRFKHFRIEYIDHSVIEFLRSNKQIWDRMGTNLELSIANVQPIWDVFVREILPIFATNIRHLRIEYADDLDNLRHCISPTILTDLNHLNSITSFGLCPDRIADDGPNATGGQALSKWLHTPSKDGQPKQLHYISPCHHFCSYHIQLRFDTILVSNEPFELVNEGTNEKLIMWKNSGNNWLLKRCPIIGEKKDENWDDNLNTVQFNLRRGIHCIGPLSPPAEEEKQADE